MTPEERVAAYLETGIWDPAWGPLPEHLPAVRAGLADAASWEPPTDVDAVLAAISREQTTVTAARTPPADPTAGPPPARRRLHAGWLSAAAAAVVVAVVAVLALQPDDEPRPGRTFELAGTEVVPAASASGRVWSTSAGEWYELHLEGLPPAEPGTYYQGWVHNDGARVSIGTFHAHGDEDAVHLWSGVPVEEFPRVTVTRQEVGDDGRPGPVVLEGEVPLDDAQAGLDGDDPAR